MYDAPFDKKYHLDINLFSNPKTFGEISLYQIGRVYCKEKTRVPRHTHLDFFEMTIVTGGCGTVITNDVAVEVKQGDIYVSFAGDFYEIASDPDDPLRYDFVALQTVNERMHNDLEEIVRSFHDPQSRVIRSENIAPLISGAIAELNAAAEYSEEVLSAIFIQVFAHLIRGFDSQSKVKYSKNTGEPEVLCYQLMNYIDSHIYTMKNLRELSEVTNYTYNYLSNLYKKVTSDTLANYFRNRRLEAARLLLIEGTMSVTKISSLLNYSSVYIFSRAFKEKYGVPPSELKKKRETTAPV